MADFAVAGHEIGPVAFVAQNSQTNFLKLLKIALIGCGGSKNRVVSTTANKPFPRDELVADPHRTRLNRYFHNSKLPTISAFIAGSHRAIVVSERFSIAQSAFSVKMTSGNGR
jgi:hypothetical protein